MKIYENDDCDEVIINDLRMTGSITEVKCDKCNNNLIHSEEYDFFCPECNKVKKLEEDKKKLIDFEELKSENERLKKQLHKKIA